MGSSQNTTLKSFALPRSRFPPSATFPWTIGSLPQLVVLNHRELLEADEPYRLELTIPGKTSADEAPCLHYRQLGKGSFKTLAMQADDAHHFSVTIPQTLKGTIEYYISFKHHGNTYHYPAAAPSICATWVKLSATEGCVNASRKD